MKLPVEKLHIELTQQQIRDKAMRRAGIAPEMLAIKRARVVQNSGRDKQLHGRPKHKKKVYGLDD